MLSIYAKIFYYILSLLPFVLLGFCPVLYLKFGVFTLLLVIVIFIAEIVGLHILFNWISHNIPETSISINSVEVNDESFLGSLLSYLIPLTSFFLDNKGNDLLMICSLVIIVCAIMCFLRNVIVSPFLVILRYHCYKISVEKGVDGCLLITKDTIYSPKEISSAIQIFPYIFVGR